LDLQTVNLSVGEMVDAASGFLEASQGPPQQAREALGKLARRRKGATPARPLTCPGLHPRKHPLASHPTLGLRPPSSPTLPLPEWQSPLCAVEYAHQRPFESAFFADPLAQPFVVGGVLPNSCGHFLERRRDGTGVYSKAHAAQALEALHAHPQRPTDWAQANLHHRDKSFQQLKVNVQLFSFVIAHILRHPTYAHNPNPLEERLTTCTCAAQVDNIELLSDDSRLYVPTSKRLGSDDAAAGDALRLEINAIARARKQHQRATCGLTQRSKVRAQQNRDASEGLRLARELAVQAHMLQHDDKLLAYRLAFDKFDVDGRCELFGGCDVRL
jgi:hypothetical protein